MELNELAHHGVKGQKWGVRRTPEQLGHKPKSKSTEKREREDREHARSETKMLSDEELRSRVKRLQLEKQYRELLSSEEKSKIIDGRALVSSILSESIKELGKSSVHYTVGGAINKVTRTDMIGGNVAKFTSKTGKRKKLSK